MDVERQPGDTPAVRLAGMRLTPVRFPDHRVGVPTRSHGRTKDMNEAASLILSEAVGGRPATSTQTAARGAAAALLGKPGGEKQPPDTAEARPGGKNRRPATAKARRSTKR